MTKICARNGYEVWTHYDPTAQLWELFASEAADDYIGCADTLADARAVGNQWIDHRLFDTE